MKTILPLSLAKEAILQKATCASLLPALLALLLVANARAAEPTPAELVKAGVPKDCKLERSSRRELADQDKDGKPEQLIRCHRKNNSDEAKHSLYESKPCESVYLVYSRGRAKLLAAFCPGPHGSRGMGEDQIKIEGNTLTQTQSGGTAWGFHRSCELDLAPPRARAVWNSEDWMLSLITEKSSMLDYDSGVERVEWRAPLCGKEEAEEATPSTAFSGTYLGVPLLEVAAFPPAATTAPSWDSRCRLSLRQDEYAVRGSGAYGGAKDARVEFWGFDDHSRLELWAHIRDDRFATSSPKWLANDHLELWLSDLAYYSEQCLPNHRIKKGVTRYVILPSQQMTRILSFGEKRSEGISASASWPKDGSLLLRIELGPAARTRALEGAITLAYSDSDDGLRQKYVLATSQIRADDARTLGGLSKSICALDDKQRPVVRQPTSCTEVFE